MPNHFHGVIIFKRNPHYAKACKQASLGQIIGALKSKTNVLTRKNIFPDMKSVELWQKSFYDRVIRSEVELLKIREYIQNNPLKWSLDEYYV
ncbi:MAG: transposase [Candidatus Doudnabacteria bacterium]|nr:transposase [Candidatus Doudnabacteria bacterium]